MENTTILKLLFISLLAFCSCESTDPDPIEVISVDQEFEVFPIQKLSIEGSQVFLNVRSIEPDSCINAVLDANYQEVDNSITLELNGIMYPEMCIEGYEYIQKEFVLPPKEGVYSIDFVKNGFNNTSGYIEISDEKVELDIENLGGVFVLASSLSLIQENYAWGFLALRNGVGPNSNFNLEEVVSELESILRGFENVPEGTYSYFSVDEDGSVILPDQKEGAIPLAFDMPNPDSWEDLKRALEFVTESRNEVFFAFTNGQGENHHN